MVELIERKIINVIRYTGLKNLTKEESNELKLIFDRNYEKIHRLFKNNITDLEVNTKTYNEGKSKKYSIHIKAEAPTKIFATEAFDRDIKRATRKALNDIINEIKHNFESKESRFKALKLKQFLRKK